MAFIQDFESGRTLMDGKELHVSRGRRAHGQFEKSQLIQYNWSRQNIQGHCIKILQELTSEDIDTKMRNLCFIPISGKLFEGI